MALILRALIGSALILIPSISSAAGSPPLVATPFPTISVSPERAGLFELNVRLPEGRGLSALLLQAGVVQEDAAAAAKVAAGHLGNGSGGCVAKVQVSQSIGNAGFRIARLVLTTEVGRAIIERRQGELMLASVINLSKSAALI